MPRPMSMIGTYLYENNFIVFLAPLPGHSLQGARWSHTFLRDEYGGSKARKLPLNDSDISDVVNGINNGTLFAIVHGSVGFDMEEMTSRVLNIFKEGFSAEMHAKLMKAFDFLTREDCYDGLEEKFLCTLNPITQGTSQLPTITHSF